MQTQILELYLKGYSNIEIMDKLQCDKWEIGKVFSRMTDKHHENLKMKAQNHVAQASNMEKNLFDNIHKLSDKEYFEQRDNLARFCVK